MFICYATSQNSKERNKFPNWCRKQDIEILEIFSSKELNRISSHKPDLFISDRFNSIFEKS
jgi:hypothetical protein